MRTALRVLPAAACLLLGGCLAASVAAIAAPGVGGAVRSGQRKTDVVLGQGVTPAMIGSRKHLGLSINPVNASGQYVMAMGSGTTNTHVYSDMIAKELLRLGYEARVIADTVPEMLTPAMRAELTGNGFDIVLVGNFNVAMTTNYGATMVGGEYANTGVTSFTVKGIDPGSGTLLFILSTEYGSAKRAGDVATDLSQIYRDMVAGTVPSSQR